MARLSKTKANKLGGFLCKILRHSPSQFHVSLDEYGYAPIDELLNAISSNEKWANLVNVEMILEVVKTDEKQRYKLDSTGTKIKARYGHSIAVKSDEEQNRVLPDILYHGTGMEHLDSIQNLGLLPMKRVNVHLSETTFFANKSAKRNQFPVLLKVDTIMAKNLGVTFEYAGDEVWLSSLTPSDCLTVVTSSENKEI
ncbi:RNA 2'-phosphotransferase [Bacillus cereus]|uniref:RNA 2'-phosphotransferase n=1 Tax=Bacillus cereus TaxID=1396 RepID=UPI002405E1A6|nr:RNA 2'-phosphotransferase [Bacillus cereus]MDF9599615.1 RNA 2'-phosphotransferase [Bacillus cereus]MDG1589234.1 RNA 2'-phosphotransferase [Bacillus cereus]